MMTRFTMVYSNFHRHVPGKDANDRSPNDSRASELDELEIVSLSKELEETEACVRKFFRILIIKLSIN